MPVWSPRPGWDAVPDAVRDWAGALLEAPISRTEECTGGFSAGLATRLIADDGSRLFVKAVCPALNPASPALHRAEARIGMLLADAAIAVPHLRGVHDDGDWVALAFDDVGGANPHWPWGEQDLQRTLDGLGELHEALTPAPDGPIQSADVTLADDLGAWTVLLVATRKLERLSPWLGRHARELARRSAQIDLSGSTLLNLDVRADNVVLDPDGRPWFVDWPWACRGPAAVDVVVLLVDAAVAGHDPEEWLARSSAAGADPELITDILAVLTGVWALGATRAEPPGTRGIRAFQRAHLTAGANWLRQRLGD